MSSAKWPPFCPGGICVKANFYHEDEQLWEVFLHDMSFVWRSPDTFSVLKTNNAKLFRVICHWKLNQVCSNLDSTGLVRSHICTCLDSPAVVASAKLWPDQMIRLNNQLAKQWNDRRNLTDHRWKSQKASNMGLCYYSVVRRLNKLWKKQSSCRWFETQRRLGDVIVRWFYQRHIVGNYK